MEEKAYHLQADMLKALAHPTRLKILELLCDGERCVCEIEPALGRRQPNISQHLAILRASRLVEARKEGVRMIYRVTDRRVFQALDLLTTVSQSQADEARRAFAARRTTQPEVAA